MALHPEVVGLFLERYGAALSAGDPATMAGSWEAPALVLDDCGVVALSSDDEVAHLCAQAMAWFRAQGYAAMHGVVLQVEALGERVCELDVRCTMQIVAGKDVASEHSRYLLRLDDEGAPRIRVALTVTREARQ